MLTLYTHCGCWENCVQSSHSGTEVNKAATTFHVADHCARERTLEGPAQQILSWAEIHIICALNAVTSTLPMYSEEREKPDIGEH